jgi:hypothetical protein
MCWPNFQILQHGRHGNIKRTRRPPMQFDCRFEHLKRPRMHADRPRPAFAVEPPHVARRLLEAHQRMHFRDHVECRTDRRLHVGLGRAGDRDLNECPKQRPRPAQAGPPAI